MNAERPRDRQKTVDELAERLLRSLFGASKHFGEGATVEYLAIAGARTFETPVPAAVTAAHNIAVTAAAALVPPGPVPDAPVPKRDFTALIRHYDALWRQVVRDGVHGFNKRDPRPRPVGQRRVR
jgi:hypothetical protein